MDIGQIIKEYRESHGLSQRQFSQMFGISNTYVSYLEKGRGTNAKRVAPTLNVVRGIARGMGMTLQDLIAMCDDFEVDISGDAQRELENEFLMLLRSLPDNLKLGLLAQAQTLASLEESPGADV